MDSKPPNVIQRNDGKDIVKLGQGCRKEELANNVKMLYSQLPDNAC